MQRKKAVNHPFKC